MHETEAKRDPAVHVITPSGDKLGICLSKAMKWVAGATVSVAGTLLMGVFLFAWESNSRLGKVEAMTQAIANRDRSLEQLARENRDRIYRNTEEVAELKGRMRAIEMRERITVP